MNDYKINVNFNDNKWLINEKFSVGDIIFIENLDGNYVIRQIPEVNGAIVVINPHNGNVLALSGGYSFKISEFNRATQAKRQPGSAFKPFVYAAALENGFSSNSIVLDAPFVAQQGIGLKDWKPENYGKKFYGPSTLRKGIEYSRNLIIEKMKNVLMQGWGLPDCVNARLSNEA
mgnify:CR=1 FL=1